MPIAAFLLAWIAVLNLGIGFYVCRRNPSAPLNRAFAFTALTIGLWTIALAWGRFQPASFEAAIRTAFAAGSLCPFGILLFVEHFGGTAKAHNRRLRVLTVVAMAMSALSFSPWMVTGVTHEPYGMRPLYGFLHPFLASYVLLTFGLATTTLAQQYQRLVGLQKIQAGHLFLAFILPGLLGATTNVFVPLIAGTSAYNGLGPVFSLILIAMVAHAIIRHRLMDIRIVIRRGVGYLVTLSSSAALFVILLFGSNFLLPLEHGFSVRDIVLVLIVALAFQSVKSRVQHLLDRYLYREPYDYARTLREASRALTATIDLQELLGHVGGALTSTLRPEGMSIYLLDSEDHEFRLAWSVGTGTPVPVASATSPLISMVSADRQLVFRDEIGRTRPTDRDRLLPDLDGLRAEVVVPLVEENVLIGFLLLGAKRSGDPYFSNDADLLTTLANQAAVAVRNAQTHARVVQVNEEMRKVLETIESGVVAVGPRGRITLFNRAAEQLTGTSAETARGQSPECLPAPLGAALRATSSDGEPRSQIEFSLPDAAGQMVPLMCSTSPLRGPDGAPLGAVAVLADMSRLKELEQEKRRAERLASIEAIASGLIHEIRNPLVGIKTSRSSSLAWRQRGVPGDVLAVSGPRDGRIDDLLSRFRTMSRASQHPMEMVDVSDPLRDTLETLHAELEDRRSRLRRVGEQTRRPVLGNASQLQQLFMNLCLNAMQAMEPGGELTVRVADLTEGAGARCSSKCGHRSRHSRAPPGTIFDPFVSTKPHGTGLGLAICRGVADAHRARLRARNNSERSGSTFTIEFPVPGRRPSPTTAA